MVKSLHSKEYSVFVEMLAEARKKQGLTQQQVADRLKKPQSYVAKLEGGERRVDIVEFKELAEAMNCDPRKLFDAFLKKV